jgi:hypothetical protein
MSHIATVFVRAEQRPDRKPELTPADLLPVLLSGNGGHTYYVPLWEQVTGGLIDLQFGANYHALCQLEDLWAQFGDRLTSVWTRWMGSEFDEITSCVGDSAKIMPIRLCTYWFDEIRLTPTPTGLAVPPGWSVTATGWRSTTGPHRRFAYNDRYPDRDCAPAVPRTTSTTPAYPVWLDSEDWFDHYRRDLGLSAEMTDQIAAHDERLARVELCWRGQGCRDIGPKRARPG